MPWLPFPARLQELSLLDSTKSIKFDNQWNFAGGFSTSKFAGPFSIMQPIDIDRKSVAFRPVELQNLCHIQFAVV